MYIVAMELTKFPSLQLLTSSVIVAVGWLLVRMSRVDRPPNPGGQKLGIEKSNLEDEFEYPVDGDEDWKVKSLWVYPVKSCRGVELDEANVIPTGFEHDRQFMFAEKKPHPQSGTLQWTFITQRKYPQMALITTTLQPLPKCPTGGTLTVTFPVSLRKFPYSLSRREFVSFSVPLAANESIMSAFPLVPVKIWLEYPLGHDMSSAVAGELRELERFLGTKGELALFRVCDSKPRVVYRNAPRKEELGHQSVVGFADAYPLHLLNLASVRELNSRIVGKIPELSIGRFRANIIVSGPKAFQEDGWKKITFDGRVYYSSCRTVRCKLPNVDQETGEKHMQEPDQTLRSYRNIDAGSPKNACLGMQLVPADKFSTLKVGDKLVVLETGDHLYIPFSS